MPEPPGYTAQEATAEAHDRAPARRELLLASRCRLANAYLYDAEIILRVQLALRVDGRFGTTTSLWAAGRRRFVWLQGCVATAEPGSRGRAHRARDRR